MIKMKKFFIAAAVSLAAVTVVFAGEKDTVSRKDPRFVGFVSNGFWDNWDFSLNGGMTTALAGKVNRGAFGQRLGYEVNLGFSKWLHPAIGVRLQAEGGVYGNFNKDMVKVEWPYAFVHIDAMFNLCDWIGGYREDRVYSFIPTIGMGYMAACFANSLNEKYNTEFRHGYAFSYGIMNKFRLSEHVDLNIEINGLLAPTHMNATYAVGDGRFTCGIGVTAGVSFRLSPKKHTNIREVNDAHRIELSRRDSVSEVQIRALSDRIEAAQGRETVYKGRIEALEDSVSKMVSVKTRPLGSASLDELFADPLEIVFFDYGMARLNNVDKTRLDLLARRMKEGDPGYVYTVCGFADMSTGNPVKNRRLAEKRAKVVYDYLVSQGVPESQLSYFGMTTGSAPFESVANQSVLIK